MFNDRDDPDWSPRPVGNYVSQALTDKQIVTLAELGLDMADYTFFHDHFVGHFWNYAHKPRGKSWFSVAPAKRISHSLLIGHLAGRYDIATYCRRAKNPEGRTRYVTDRFVIDLDAHRDDGDLCERYEAVASVFGTPTLLFRSSESGGLHLHYWLDQQVDLQRLLSPDGNRNMLPRLLAAHALQPQSGRIELYPRGCYRYLSKGNRLRVPFGIGSRLLDPESFTPLNSDTRLVAANATDLRMVRQRMVNGEIEPISFDELYKAMLRTPHSGAPSRGRKFRAEPPHSGPTAYELLADGLTGPKQLDAAIGSLAYHYWHEWESEDEAIAMIVGWLDRYHNGRSITYNRKPREAYAMIRDRVPRVYAKCGSRPPRKWAPVHGLSSWESSLVFDATITGCDVSTGEEVDLYKFQKFCFELVRSAKQWVLTEGQLLWNSLAERSKHEADGQMFTRALLARCSHFWPNPAEPRFVVGMPYKQRLKCGGLSRSGLTPNWKAARYSGLFSLHRKANPDIHRCEEYSVALDFSAFDSAEINRSVDQLLVARLTRGERRHRYSNYRCKQLAKVEHETANMYSLEDFVSAFEDFIRRQLVSAGRLSQKGTEVA